MAGDYFPMGLWRSRCPEVIAISAATGRSRHEVLGLLCDFWSWASSESVDGYIRGVRLCHLPRSVCADEPFWRAVADVGWVAEDERGIVIPGWDNWLSASAKKRARDVIRKRLQRKKRPHFVRDVSAKCPTKSGTREERIEKREDKKEEPPVDPPSKVAAKPEADLPAKAVPIPPELDSPEFLKAWSEWDADRRARKKPLTDRARSMQLSKLARLGVALAIECVEYSIANGYQGLIFDRFEESVRAKTNVLKTKGQLQDEYFVHQVFGISKQETNADDTIAIEE